MGPLVLGMTSLVFMAILWLTWSSRLVLLRLCLGSWLCCGCICCCCCMWYRDCSLPISRSRIPCSPAFLEVSFHTTKREKRMVEIVTLFDHLLLGDALETLPQCLVFHCQEHVLLLHELELGWDSSSFRLYCVKTVRLGFETFGLPLFENTLRISTVLSRWAMYWSFLTLDRWALCLYFQIL